MPPAWLGARSWPSGSTAVFAAHRSPLDELQRRLEPWWNKACDGLARRSSGRADLGSRLAGGPAPGRLPVSSGLADRHPAEHSADPADHRSLSCLVPREWGSAWSGLRSACCRSGSPTRLLQATETIVRWASSQPWGHRFVAGPCEGWVSAFYASCSWPPMATTLAAGARQRGGSVSPSLVFVLSAGAFPAA